MKEFQNQTTEVYAEFGKILVNMGALEHTLQESIKALFKEQGLQNENIVHICLDGMTGEPLKAKHQSIVMEIFKPSKEVQKLLNSLYKEISELIIERNHIIHSVSYVGYINLETSDYRTIGNIKHKSNKSGYSPKIRHFHLDELRHMVKQTDRCIMKLRHVTGGLLTKLPLEQVFQQDLEFGLDSIFGID
jgi:hypothetical protein